VRRQPTRAHGFARISGDSLGHLGLGTRNLRGPAGALRVTASGVRQTGRVGYRTTTVAVHLSVQVTGRPIRTATSRVRQLTRINDRPTITGVIRYS
jgi:hypothetical protein